ncbi:MAG TPA: cobalt ECF transporter T component CbiQ [Bryobacteraceae bacterium]|jgi:cobalt/nickel transport system permease protein|nr:cobalt ECF transporter T component CbiQ [Bryobacteraceae bacterium]
MRRSFVERTIGSLSQGMNFAALAEDSARADGLLQRVDPRVKVAGMLAMIVSVALTHSLIAIGAILLLAAGLAIASRISWLDLARWVWTPVLLFTGCLALPAIFITPGTRLYANWPVTEQGIRTASYLLLRAETAVSLSTLLVLSTRWAHILKALRVLRMPVVFVVILGMTYRYLFLILETALDMFESRESRRVGVLEAPDRRRLATATVGVLLSKSYHLSADVHLAMQSRGFRGEVYMLDDFEMRLLDLCWLFFFFAIAAAVIWVGR